MGPARPPQDVSVPASNGGGGQTGPRTSSVRPSHGVGVQPNLVQLGALAAQAATGALGHPSTTTQGMVTYAGQQGWHGHGYGHAAVGGAPYPSSSAYAPGPAYPAFPAPSAFPNRPPPSHPPSFVAFGGPSSSYPWTANGPGQGKGQVPQLSSYYPYTSPPHGQLLQPQQRVNEQGYGISETAWNFKLDGDDDRRGAAHRLLGNRGGRGGRSSGPARGFAAPSAGHLKCDYENCTYSTFSARDLRIHRMDRHLIYPEGWHEKHSKLDGPPGARIQGTSVKLDSPEDIARWIAERKKRWPSAKVVAEKENARQERIARGELDGSNAISTSQRGRGRRRGYDDTRGGRGGRDRGRGGRADAGDRRGAKRRRPDEASTREDQERSKRNRKAAPPSEAVKTKVNVLGIAYSDTSSASSDESESTSSSDSSDSSSDSDAESTSSSALDGPEALSSRPPASAASNVLPPGSSAKQVLAAALEGHGGSEGEEVENDEGDDGAGARSRDEGGTETRRGQRITCKWWRMGRCKSGDSCRFEHADPAPNADRWQADQRQGPQRSRGPKPPPKNPFQRESLLRQLLTPEIDTHLSSLSQAIRFLVTNDFLRDVELREGDAEEQRKRREKIQVLRSTRASREASSSVVAMDATGSNGVFVGRDEEGGDEGEKAPHADRADEPGSAGDEGEGEPIRV